MLNALYFVAAVLMLGVAYNATMRDPPPSTLRSNWPLRRFWVSEPLRRIAIALTCLSGAIGVSIVIGTGIGVAWGAMHPVLMGTGVVLAALGALALGYSLLLYRIPSAAEPHGF